MADAAEEVRDQRGRQRARLVRRRRRGRGHAQQGKQATAEVDTY